MLGKCSDNERYYIRGILRQDGFIDSEKYVSIDGVDRTSKFIGKMVVPEYIGVRQFDAGAAAHDFILLKMLAKAAGSKHPTLEDVTQILKDTYEKEVIPKRANAFALKTDITQLRMPGCCPPVVERYSNTLVFLRIPAQKK